MLNNITMMETVAREQHDSRLKHAEHNRVVRQVTAKTSRFQVRRSSRQGGLFSSFGLTWRIKEARAEVVPQ